MGAIEAVRATATPTAPPIPEAFNWDAVTAAATAVLALLTAALAVTAWRALRSSSRAADAARDAAESSERAAEHAARTAVETGRLADMAEASSGPAFEMRVASVGGDAKTCLQITASGARVFVQGVTVTSLTLWKRWAPHEKPRRIVREIELSLLGHRSVPVLLGASEPWSDDNQACWMLPDGVERTLAKVYAVGTIAYSYSESGPVRVQPFQRLVHDLTNSDGEPRP